MHERMLIYACHVSSDSDFAPLLKRCEGHLAGGPLPGELLLSGGGASQQAGGGGQVCPMACALE